MREVMKSRCYEEELIDLGPSYYSEKEYDECLIQLGRIGRFLGGNQATLQAFRKFSPPSSILDVGCGGGDLAIELAKHFPKTDVLGIDISNEAIRYARNQIKNTTIKNVRFEVPASPELSYERNSFDVITCSLVCHHLKDDELIGFLKKSYQVAKKYVIINDLHRHWIAYLSFACIAKPFFRNRLIFHDGLLSIKRAFKKEDWIIYLKAAEIPLEHCSITWHWAFRWIVHIDTSHK
jgi:2-polyprenyl-3-methyl-5-hydroxy-6-metoxy-1,4-benzoquinol methylase